MNRPLHLVVDETPFIICTLSVSDGYEQGMLDNGLSPEYEDEMHFNGNQEYMMQQAAARYGASSRMGEG